MGIDPLTHRPLSPTTMSSYQPKQKQPPLEDGDGSCQKHRNSEDLVHCAAAAGNANETRVESKSNSTASEQAMARGGGERGVGDSLMMTSSTTSDTSSNKGFFCTDEVPLMAPDEILVPCSSSTLLSLPSSASISSSGSDVIFEDLQLPYLEWPSYYHSNDVNNNETGLNSLWDEDGFCLDFLINDECDSKLTVDQLLNQYPAMIVDQTFGLF